MSSDYSVTTIFLKRPGSGVSSGKGKSQSFGLVIDREAFNKTKNMTDSDILLSSLNYADKESKKTVAGKLLGALPSLFLVAMPALFGVMQKGPLSSKLASALSTAAIFGAGTVLCDKVDDISKRVKAKSPKLDEAGKKHPIPSLIGNIALKSIALTAALVGASKGAGLIQKHFAPSVDSFSKTLSHAAKKIDASRAGKTVSKMSNSFQAFSEKHPKLSGFASKHSYLAPLAMLFGWMGFSDAVSKKVESNQVKFASQRAEDLLLLRVAANQIDAG